MVLGSSWRYSTFGFGGVVVEHPVAEHEQEIAVLDPDEKT